MVLLFKIRNGHLAKISSCCVVLKNKYVYFSTLNILNSVTDLSQPHLWYPEARRLGRKIICHIGPTNSGKTFQALQRLKSASNGIYCGPLRLLAWEVFERLNDSRIPCNLITGQEINKKPNALHTSCTVEMADLQSLYECAVIDEAQLLGCSQRGWAWTRALLGLKTRELHLCGSPSFISLVRMICSNLGEPVEEIYYERLGELEVSEKPLKMLSEVQPGDCVVAFSRRSLFKLKQAIERENKGRLKCCLIYGALPPETRRAQARVFNDPDNSTYEVLVATDAIGMGLNLSIKRVVFASLKKSDGVRTRALLPSEIKQIGGRAGRFQSVHPKGIITVIGEETDLRLLEKGFSTPDKEIKSAGLFPTVDQLQQFAKLSGLPFEDEDRGLKLKIPKRSTKTERKEKRRKVHLSHLLEQFARIAQTDKQGVYFMCDITERKVVADYIHSVPLSFEHRYIFMLAPVDVKSRLQMRWLKEYAHQFCKKRQVKIGLHINTKRLPENPEQLQFLEDSHAVLDMYLWLGLRFKQKFSELIAAQHQQNCCSQMIEMAIKKMKAPVKI